MTTAPSATRFESAIGSTPVNVPRDHATAEIRAEGGIREQTGLCLENLWH